MEGVSIWLLLGAAGVFFGGVFVYVLFMIFLPEWVGITGKVALEAERSHKEGAEVSDDDVLAKMQQKPTSKK